MRSSLWRIDDVCLDVSNARPGLLANASHKLSCPVLQAARNSGFTFGVQFKPQGLISLPQNYLQIRNLSQFPQDAAKHISYALAYSPEGKTTFGELAAAFLLYMIAASMF